MRAVSAIRDKYYTCSQSDVTWTAGELALYCHGDFISENKHSDDEDSDEEVAVFRNKGTRSRPRAVKEIDELDSEGSEVGWV